MKTGCYIATNKHNGKQYVGKTADYTQRKYVHKSKFNKSDACKKFYPAIRKHGWDAFEWNFYYCPKGLLKAFERGLIAACDSYKNGYNATEGGDGRGSGYKLSEEHKRKISESHKGVKLSDEHKKSLSVARKNRAPHSDETKAKMSKSGMGKGVIDICPRCKVNEKGYYSTGNKRYICKKCDSKMRRKGYQP